MEIFLVLFVITLVFSLTLASHWLDTKYNLQLVRWLNCEVSSPFKKDTVARHRGYRQTAARPQADSDELRERIENLEKIVTDSSWELNQKIKNL